MKIPQIRKSRRRQTMTSTVPEKNLRIVGIGASAGGLEAFIQLLSSMPVDTGMAFVLIQHLDPSHPSLSANIISKTTKLKIQEVQDGMFICPNQIYLIPPNANMGISKGVCTYRHARAQVGDI